MLQLRDAGQVMPGASQQMQFKHGGEEVAQVTGGACYEYGWVLFGQKEGKF